MTQKAGDLNATTTIVGSALPNSPWEEKPENCKDVVWRSARNPVIPRDLLPGSNSIFNSAVVPFEDGFAGVFRVDNKKREMRIHSGKSRDGMFPSSGSSNTNMTPVFAGSKTGTM
jgi:predicted GH43/DUF377 family glycosyl hydrolase